MKKFKLLLPIALLAVVLFSSCSKDDEESNELDNPIVTVYNGANEEITTI